MALQRKSRKKPTQSGQRRNVWLLILTTILVVGSIFLFTPPNERINQGLDIRGGLSVVLQAESADGNPITNEQMELSRSIIENRVNALGASEATVQVQGNDQILVQIPGLSDTEEALNTIGRTGSLVLARLDSFTDSTVRQRIESGNYVSEGIIYDDYGNQFPSGKLNYLSVQPGTYTPLVTGDEITNVTVGLAGEASTTYAVNVTLDAQGAAAFAEATRELAPTHGKIVIILDNEVQSAPSVQSEIPDGHVQITGGYTLEEAQSLQTILQSGKFPVNFSQAQSLTVGPKLGQDALSSGVIVAIVGICIVMIYLLCFYKGLGIITALAMLVFATLYLGILAALSALHLFSLSLAGIAGIVLTIGMAADSSILTLERFREEIRLGRSVRAASISGVRHAILTSIDADLVTLVSALSLFFLAAASVKGFGLTLALGIFCDIIMMLIFKAPIIRLLAPRSIAKHPNFWGISDSLAVSRGYSKVAQEERRSVREVEEAEAVNPVENEDYARSMAGDKAMEDARAAAKIKGRFIKHDINFMGARRIFLTIAAVVIALCFIVTGIRGINFGIEFVGGTSITFTDTGDTTIDAMRAAMDDVGESDAVIQTTTTSGEPGFLVRTTTTSPEEAAAHAADVAMYFGWSTDNFQVSTIGPDWGASVVRSSIIALLVSLVLIIIYIAIRFEYKMGVTAIVALFHDLIIVMGIYALIGKEFTPNTIAALLTILGYSLYDTVVVFHRINDNMQGDTIRCTFMTMANHSINQVFIRTINTTLTTLIPVVAMLIFGGETLKDFAFPMVIGLIAGSYSSIAIATPLYALWKQREPRYAKLLKKYGSEVGCFAFDHAGAPPIASVPVARQEALKAQADQVTITSRGKRNHNSSIGSSNIVATPSTDSDEETTRLPQDDKGVDKLTDEILMAPSKEEKPRSVPHASSEAPRPAHPRGKKRSKKK